MSLYWAKFKNVGSETFRLDTRIYLNKINAPSEDDVCVGAIVGKNPGSAKASSISDNLQAITLDGDKLLPTVRNIVFKAYNESGRSIPNTGYIQVLNLFYLCIPDLGAAIAAMQNCTGLSESAIEGKDFPWVWYVWGGESVVLNNFKSRFSNLNSLNHFFYDNKLLEIAKRPASESDFAKHTQGLKHEYIVPYLASVIRNG